MKKYWPYLLGAGLVAWYFSKLKKASESIKVNLSDIKLKKGKGLSLPILELNFDILNPTGTTVNVLGVTGDVYVNDQYLSNVSNLNAVQIPSNGSIVYTVDVKTSAIDAFNSVISLIKAKKEGKSKGLYLKANLDVNVDGILYPITIDRKVI
jgi:LEA14-like dessication related protein